MDTTSAPLPGDITAFGIIFTAIAAILLGAPAGAIAVILGETDGFDPGKGIITATITGTADGIAWNVTRGPGTIASGIEINRTRAAKRAALTINALNR